MLKRVHNRILCSLSLKYIPVGVYSKNINKMLCLLLQNPGFDFSGAEISGNYTKGGPDFSSLER